MKTHSLIYNDNPLRFYEAPNNLLLPSVTTILGLTSDNSWLDEIIKRIGIDKLNALRDFGLERGSIMHEWLEYIMLNNIQTLDEFFEKYGLNIFDLDKKQISAYTMIRRFFEMNWQKGWVNVIMNETPIYWYENHIGFAGRLDMLANRNTGPVLLDFKSASLKKEINEWTIPNYFMQISAYWEALKQLKLTVPKSAALLIMSDTEQFWANKYKINAHDQVAWFGCFRLALYEFNEIHLPEIKKQNKNYF